MTMALAFIQIVIGVFIVAAGAFVIAMGLRRPAGQWPKAYKLAFALHIGIAIAGLAVIGNGIAKMLAA